MEDTLRALDTTQRLLESIGAVADAASIESLRSSVRPEPRSPVPRSTSKSSRVTSPTLEFTLEEIVQYLNEEQIRATYGAVAGIVGGIAQGIGARLGERRRQASWVVNASSGTVRGEQAQDRR